MFIRERKKQPYLIFTAAESSTAAHGKAQLVLRLIAAIKAEQPAGLGISQAHTEQHQAVSLVPSSHLAPVVLFPAPYAVNAHPTTNAASNSSLSDMGARAQPGLLPLLPQHRLLPLLKREPSGKKSKCSAT